MSCMEKSDLKSSAVLIYWTKMTHQTHPVPERFFSSRQLEPDQAHNDSQGNSFYQFEFAENLGL